MKISAASFLLFEYAGEEKLIPGGESNKSSTAFFIGGWIWTNENARFHPLWKTKLPIYSSFSVKKKTKFEFFRSVDEKIFWKEFFLSGKERKKFFWQQFFLVHLPTSYIVALNRPTLIRFSFFFFVTLLVSVCSCVCARAPSLVGTKKSTKKTIKLLSNITFVWTKKNVKSLPNAEIR